MELSDAVAQFALYAEFTPKRLAANRVPKRIGRRGSQVPFSGCDILYQVEMEATGAAGDSCQLDLETGAVTLLGGTTPTVRRTTNGTSDLAGTDLEGIALPNLNTFCGVIIEWDSDNDKYIAMSCDEDYFPDLPQGFPGFVLPFLAPEAGYDTGGDPGDITFTWEVDALAPGDIVSATVLGKTT